MNQNHLDQIDQDIAAKHLLNHPFYLDTWRIEQGGACRLCAAILPACGGFSDLSLGDSRKL